MNDSKDYIEKELGQLAKKIFDNFKTRSYTAQLHSKIYRDIVYKFIEMRLRIFLIKLDIDPSIKLKKYDYTSILQQLSHFDKTPQQNLTELQQLLKRTLPSISTFINSKEYLNGNNNLDRVLEYIRSFEIQIKKTDLIKFNNKIYKITQKLLKEYNILFSIMLTINISLESINVGCLDFPDRIFNKIKPNRRSIKLNINDVVLQIEKLIYKILQHIMNKEVGLIKTLYRFPNREAEIENVREYLKTNNLWKLDIIKTDFLMYESKDRLCRDINNKLELIRGFRTHEHIVLKYGTQIPYNESNRYLNKDYLKTIKIELQRSFEEWLYHPIIADWENYWIGKRNLYLYNVTKNSFSVSELNSIKQTSFGWEIFYSDENRIVNNLIGIYYFSKCLKSPGTEFSYSNLMNAHSIEDLLINKERSDLLNKRTEIKFEIMAAEANKSEDPTYYELELDELEMELFTIESQIQQFEITSLNTPLTGHKACLAAMEHCKNVFPKFYKYR